MSLFPINLNKNENPTLYLYRPPNSSLGLYRKYSTYFEVQEKINTDKKILWWKLAAYYLLYVQIIIERVNACLSIFFCLIYFYSPMLQYLLEVQEAKR